MGAVVYFLGAVGAVLLIVHKNKRGEEPRVYLDTESDMWRSRHRAFEQEQRTGKCWEGRRAKHING